MPHYDKLFSKIMHGSSDANINFEELRGFLVFLGFQERVCGSHHIFIHPDVEEILNL